MAAAGSSTQTEILLGSVKKIKFSWTSDASGNVSGGAAITTAADLCGAVVGLVTIPSGGGTVPTDQYDITVKDADGYDVLNGQGANRSSTNTETVTASLGVVAMSTLELNVANAGNAKKGTAILYIR